MHKNKLIASVAIAVVVAGGIGFYGGTLFAKSGIPSRGGNAGNFAQGFMRNGGGMPPGGTARFGNGGGLSAGQAGLTAGEVLSKDEKSITVKLRDSRLPDGQAGSRIVFFSGITQVLKSATGTVGDIATGEQVVVTGTENTDGSITAQSIQLRPAFMASSTRSR